MSFAVSCTAATYRRVDYDRVTAQTCLEKKRNFFTAPGERLWGPEQVKSTSTRVHTYSDTILARSTALWLPKWDTGGQVQAPHTGLITTHAHAARPEVLTRTHKPDTHAPPDSLDRQPPPHNPPHPCPALARPLWLPSHPLCLSSTLSLYTHTPREAAGWGEGRVLRAARGPLGAAAMAAAVAVVAAPTTVAATVVRGGICATSRRLQG